jgi:hypothetical protein
MVAINFENISILSKVLNFLKSVRFQVLTAASMMFRAVFWVVLPCKMIIRDESSLMMEAVRTSELSVDNHSTRQYNPEDSSELPEICHIEFYKILTNEL